MSKKKSRLTFVDLNQTGLRAGRVTLDFLIDNVSSEHMEKALKRAARSGQPVSECVIQMLIEDVRTLTARNESLERDNADLMCQVNKQGAVK